MNKILIVDDNQKLIEAFKKQSFVYRSFRDSELLVAKNYTEATSIISQNSSKIKIAVVSKELIDCKEGKGVMLSTTNKIPTVVLFESYDKESRIDKKLLNMDSVIGSYYKDDIKYINSLLEFINKSIRNSTYTALVVDDSSLYREMFKNDIEQLGLDVIVAKDGEEALEIFDSKKYNISLLITDYIMPNMDGIELVKRVRKNYESDQLAIIAISVDSEHKTLTEFLKAGANDYLYKPYSFEELAVRINSNINILEMFEKISNLANRDFLTSAYNRRYYFDAGSAIISKNYRKNKPVAVATIDIDKFKKVNDLYGHDVGDMAIQEVVGILNENMRSSDLIARFGGEEFCVLLEDISLENAKNLFEKIRKIFESNELKINSVISIKFTVSIGIAYEVNDSLSDLIKKSDIALYDAKNSGRNRLVIYDGEN